MEKMNVNGTNAYNCDCVVCGRNILPHQGTLVFLPSKGKRYVCEYHKDGHWLDGYCTDNNNYLGTTKKGGLQSTTLSIELETTNRIPNYSALRAFLQTYGFIATEDCTVDIEFKSPIYTGLASISKILGTMEKNNLFSATNNSDCGAHIHCGCDNIDIIRRYYHSIFVPLGNYIDSMGSDKRIIIFGSDYRGYARRIDSGICPTSHENMFNVQHDETLEFRLPRITSAKQYMQVLKFWRECVYTINTFNFDCGHENDSASIARRKALAMKCGDKLVKIAKKYFD